MQAFNAKSQIVRTKSTYEQRIRFFRAHDEYLFIVLRTRYNLFNFISMLFSTMVMKGRSIRKSRIAIGTPDDWFSDSQRWISSNNVDFVDCTNMVPQVPASSIERFSTVFTLCSKANKISCYLTANRYHKGGRDHESIMFLLLLHSAKMIAIPYV